MEKEWVMDPVIKEKAKVTVTAMVVAITKYVQGFKGLRVRMFRVQIFEHRTLKPLNFSTYLFKTAFSVKLNYF